MKKVLFISYYFPPIQSVDSTMAINTIKYLSEFGWEPIVVTVKCPGKEGIDASTTDQIPKDLMVVRTRSRENLFYRLFNRLKLIPDDVIGWLPFALRASSKVISYYPVDAIISRSNPVTSHLVAQQLATDLAVDVPWVAMFGDPWTQNPYVHYPNRWTKRRHERIEIGILKQADGIASTNQLTQQLLVDRYDISAKSVILPNTYDPAELSVLSPAQSIQSKDKLIIAHIGNFYGLRSPEPFFRALRLLIDRRPEVSQHLRVKLVGSIGGFQGLIKQYHLESIVMVTGLMSRRDALSQMTTSNILLLVDAPSVQKNVFLPAKLIEYLTSGKPILGITPPGASADVVRQTNTGVVISPVDIIEIAQAIEHYYDLYQNHKLQILPNREEIERYSAREGARKLAQFLDKLSVKSVSTPSDT